MWKNLKEQEREHRAHERQRRQEKLDEILAKHTKSIGKIDEWMREALREVDERLRFFQAPVEAEIQSLDNAVTIEEAAGYLKALDDHLDKGDRFDANMQQLLARDADAIDYDRNLMQRLAEMGAPLDSRKKYSRKKFLKWVDGLDATGEAKYKALANPGLIEVLQQRRNASREAQKLDKENKLLCKKIGKRLNCQLFTDRNEHTTGEFRDWIVQQNYPDRAAIDAKIQLMQAFLKQLADAATEERECIARDAEKRKANLNKLRRELSKLELQGDRTGPGAPRRVDTYGRPAGCQPHSRGRT